MNINKKEEIGFVTEPYNTMLRLDLSDTTGVSPSRKDTSRLSLITEAQKQTAELQAKLKCELDLPKDEQDFEKIKLLVMGIGIRERTVKILAQSLCEGLDN